MPACPRLPTVSSLTLPPTCHPTPTPFFRCPASPDAFAHSPTPGHYSLVYKSQEPRYTPSRFQARSAADPATLGPFASLPCDGDFTDDAYWAAVEKSAAEGFVLHYPSDIEASVCAKVEGFPLGWDMSRLSESTELLRALVPYLGFKDGKISGYTTPMLYVGAAGTTFAMHSEDQCVLLLF